MNNLILFLNWILNWMVFYRYSMFEWIIKIYRPGLVQAQLRLNFKANKYDHGLRSTSWSIFQTTKKNAKWREQSVRLNLLLFACLVSLKSEKDGISARKKGEIWFKRRAALWEPLCTLSHERLEHSPGHPRSMQSSPKDQLIFSRLEMGIVQEFCKGWKFVPRKLWAV